MRRHPIVIRIRGSESHLPMIKVACQMLEGCLVDGDYRFVVVLKLTEHLCSLVTATYSSVLASKIFNSKISQLMARFMTASPIACIKLLVLRQKFQNRTDFSYMLVSHFMGAVQRLGDACWAVTFLMRSNDLKRVLLQSYSWGFIKQMLDIRQKNFLACERNQLSVVVLLFKFLVDENSTVTFRIITTLVQSFL